MENELLTERAYMKKLKAWVGTFPSKAAAGRDIGMCRQQIGQILKGGKPPTDAIQDVLGYDCEIIKPPVRRQYRKRKNAKA